MEMTRDQKVARLKAIRRLKEIRVRKLELQQPEKDFGDYALDTLNVVGKAADLVGGAIRTPVLDALGAMSGNPDAITSEDYKKIYKGEAPSTSDYLKRLGSENSGTNFAVGMAADIALDPLTYLTGGASALARLGQTKKLTKMQQLIANLDNVKALKTTEKIADKTGRAIFKRPFKNLDEVAQEGERRGIFVNSKESGRQLPSDVMFDNDITGNADDIYKKTRELSDSLFDRSNEIINGNETARIDNRIVTKKLKRLQNRLIVTGSRAIKDNGDLLVDDRIDFIDKLIAKFPDDYKYTTHNKSGTREVFEQAADEVPPPVPFEANQFTPPAKQQNQNIFTPPELPNGNQEDISSELANFKTKTLPSTKLDPSSRELSERLSGEFRPEPEVIFDNGRRASEGKFSPDIELEKTTRETSTPYMKVGEQRDRFNLREANETRIDTNNQLKNEYSLGNLNFYNRDNASARKLLAKGIRDAEVEALNRVMPGLGNEWKTNQNIHGSLLSGFKAMGKDIRTITKKDFFTQVDAMLAGSAAAGNTNALGALIMKLIDKTFRNPSINTRFGKGLSNSGKNGNLDTALRRLYIMNSKKQQGE